MQHPVLNMHMVSKEQQFSSVVAVTSYTVGPNIGTELVMGLHSPAVLGRRLNNEGYTILLSVSYDTDRKMLPRRLCTCIDALDLVSVDIQSNGYRFV